MARTPKINYTNEVELKSLLIRTKNKVLELGTPRRNKRIKELVDCFIRTDNIKQTQRIFEFRKRLKDHIVWMSEKTQATEAELDRLGVIVRLMITRILTKPQFSGYTYVDEFYSDAQFKIFRYITNFDHRKISKFSGEAVNAFAYITQIIHNSIIHVIMVNKKHCDKIKQEYRTQQLKFAAENSSLKLPFEMILDKPNIPPPAKIKIHRYYYNAETFRDELKSYLENLDFDKIESIKISYPKDCDISEFMSYNIDFEELENQGKN